MGMNGVQQVNNTKWLSLSVHFNALAAPLCFCRYEAGYNRPHLCKNYEIVGNFWRWSLFVKLLFRGNVFVKTCFCGICGSTSIWPDVCACVCRRIQMEAQLQLRNPPLPWAQLLVALLVIFGEESALHRAQQHKWVVIFKLFDCSSEKHFSSSGRSEREDLCSADVSGLSTPFRLPNWLEARLWNPEFFLLMPSEVESAHQTFESRSKL